MNTNKENDTKDETTDAVPTNEDVDSDGTRSSADSGDETDEETKTK